MFDPTIFENIKVVMEGAVYDLDLQDRLEVTGRTDRVELSTMSRVYALRIKLPKTEKVSAVISLKADTEDLAGEILQLDHVSPGCALEINFHMPIVHISEECREIETKLMNIWGHDQRIVQTLSFEYCDQPDVYRNLISLPFIQKIGEEHIEDIPRLLDHVLLSLEQLSLRKKP
jgi:hypothetical protein